MARYKKQKDGRYKSKVKVGIDAQGKDVVKYVTAKTIHELDDKIDELRKRHITGNTESVKFDTLFGAFARKWYDTIKEPSLKSASAKESYRNTIDNYLIPEWEDVQVRAISTMDVQAMLNRVKDKGVGAWTMSKLFPRTREVFKAAINFGIIEVDPTAGAKKPAIEAGEPRRELTEQEQDAALYVGANHPDGLLLLILYYTGIRRGEALGLQWRDVDFKNKTVHIQRDIDFTDGGKVGELKSPAADRVIPIPDTLCAALDCVRGIGEGFVLTSSRTGVQVCRNTYDRRWYRLMMAMWEYDNNIENKPAPRSLKTDNRISTLTAHYFRHNYASILYNAGIDILSAMKWLGHSDVKTTLAIYAHLSKGKEDQNANALREALEKQSRRKVGETQK